MFNIFKALNEFNKSAATLIEIFYKHDSHTTGRLDMLIEQLKVMNARSAQILQELKRLNGQTST